MNREIQEPQRLSDAQPADERERFAAKVLRAVGEVTPPPLALARMRGQLNARLALRHRVAVRPLPRLALVVAALLATAGVVLAARSLLHARRPAASPGSDRTVVVATVPVAPSTAPAAPTAVALAAPASERSNGAGEPPRPVIGTASRARLPDPARTKPTRRAATRVTSATVAALAPEPIESDARLLAQALRKLRQEHDARGALALLDRYAQRFLAGRLAPEAALGRVEALMALGRRQEALRLLESTPAMPLGRETTLLRGELRASAGRCREANGDFGATLSVPPRDALDDRALFGRAFCHARNGDRAGARAEMQQYLSTFPQGRFAVEARRALAEPEGE